jgi:hypothetical protein
MVITGRRERRGVLFPRRGVKRVGLAVGTTISVALLILWVASVPLDFAYVHAYGKPGSPQGFYSIEFKSGRVLLTHYRGPWMGGSYWYCDSFRYLDPGECDPEAHMHMQLTPIIGKYHPFNPGNTTIAVPLWVPWLLLVLPTGLLWWIWHRPFPPHCCQRCGYNLTGNVSGVCPECGLTVAGGSW